MPVAIRRFRYGIFSFPIYAPTALIATNRLELRRTIFLSFGFFPTQHILLLLSLSISPIDSTSPFARVCHTDDALHVQRIHAIVLTLVGCAPCESNKHDASII